MGLCCWLNLSTVSTGSVILAILILIIVDWIARVRRAGVSLKGQHVVVS